MFPRTVEENAVWASRQAYIALDYATIAAAVEGVDAIPMEGFNADVMDELLGLAAQGLRRVVVMALGYRDAEKDFLPKAKKVRQPRKKLFVEVG